MACSVCGVWGWSLEIEDEDERTVRRFCMECGNRELAEGAVVQRIARLMTACENPDCSYCCPGGRDVVH